MNCYRFLIICLFLLLVHSPDCHAIMAGRAKTDLTPPPEMKASLGGYGERMSRPATGVHDRVWAKALLLESSGTKHVIITMDVLGLPPAIKPAVIERLGADWNENQILLLPSHSHTSIDMSAINPRNKFPIPQLGLFQQDLYEFVVDKLVEVIRSAENHTIPVAIGTESVNLGEGWTRNRRKDNTFIDPILTVTRIDQRSGEPFVVLVNWSTHPTLMAAEDMMFSGGWPGQLQRNLEDLIANEVMVMFYNGAEGDQSPVARSDSGPSKWERAERYGRALALKSYNLWQSISSNEVQDIYSDLEKVSLPKRCWHPQAMETGGKEYGMRDEIMEVILEELIPEQTVVSTLVLGDLAIIGIPGEMTAFPGSEIKENIGKLLGVRHVVIGGLADEWISYILTPEEYRKGGYESSVSFYGETLCPVLVEAAIKSAKSIVEQRSQK